jgi:uncharacterized protein (TIGR02246 family)
MRTSLLSLALLGTIALAGCESRADEAAEHADVSPAIEAMNDSFAQAWAQGDGVALAGLYTDDAMVMPPNSPMVQGKDAVTQFWTGSLGTLPGTTIKLTSVEVVGDEDMAHEVGNWVVSDSTGAAVDNGKYIVIWKHTPDGWRFYRDMWSSDNPPPAGS